jgi:monoamine oxidase
MLSLFGLMYIKSGGGSIESISLTKKDCAQEKRVKGGTQQISQRLLSYILADPTKAKILYESPLVEVNQEQEDRVYIKISNLNANREEIYCCKKLISSIPINQYSTIKFSPNLPFHKRNFFSICKIGNYVKSIITYKKAFWLEKGYSGMVLSDSSILSDTYKKDIDNGPLTTVWDGTTDDGEPALVTFACGNPAVEWQDQDYDVRKNEIINALVRYFGSEASEYIDYYEKNWNAELFSGGCPNVSVVASGTMSDYVRATRESFLNLHICGTESATQWQGYMDGAIESGIRVANEVAFCFSKTNPDIQFDYSKTYYFQNEIINRLKLLSDTKKVYFNSYKILIGMFSISLVGFLGYRYLNK